MIEIECSYADADDREHTVYAYLAGDDLSPDDCKDECGRSVPDTALPACFWDRVREHAVEPNNHRKICYINL